MQQFGMSNVTTVIFAVVIFGIGLLLGVAIAFGFDWTIVHDIADILTGVLSIVIAGAAIWLSNKALINAEVYQN
jgi:hypothetical protein